MAGVVRIHRRPRVLIIGPFLSFCPFRLRPQPRSPSHIPGRKGCSTRYPVEMNKDCRSGNRVGIAVSVITLAIVAGLSGCESAGTARHTTAQHQTVVAHPGDYRIRTMRRTEPVGELTVVHPGNRPILIQSPSDRYYNPITRNWERPAPFGPKNAFSPVSW